MSTPVEDGFMVDSPEQYALFGAPVADAGFVPGEILAEASSGLAPVITIVSPPQGTQIARTATLVFEVTCPVGVELQRFNIRAHGSLPWELGYRDGTPGLGYAVTRTDLSTDSEARFRFEVTRTAGWPIGAEIALEPFFGTAAALAAVNE